MTQPQYPQPTLCAPDPAVWRVRPGVWRVWPGVWRVWSGVWCVWSGVWCVWDRCGIRSDCLDNCTAEASQVLADKPACAGKPECRGVRLPKENERLAAELAKTRAALEIVGKYASWWNDSPRAWTPTQSRPRD